MHLFPVLPTVSFNWSSVLPLTLKPTSHFMTMSFSLLSSEYLIIPAETIKLFLCYPFSSSLLNKILKIDFDICHFDNR